ncbi:MAG: helix-turn-helix domain-containing protein [Candidatus Gracilibacteria bacterium]|nr:helix-turn-helix domain-containing protein [Candidatus Gracilibacteria bacterium]
MYKITRDEASLLLNLSTRSIDRYIKSGKLRSKKDGKIVYIHQDDIDNFLGSNKNKQEVIVKENIVVEEKKPVKKEVNNEMVNFIYQDLKSEIEKKDEEIKNLSVENGKLQEMIKSSISLIEFKKTQFLLEESKNGAITNLENTKKELTEKLQELNDEKKLNYILTITVVVLIILLIIIWVITI